MIEFSLHYIDYKEGSLEKDTNFSKRKANVLRDYLLEEHDIDASVNCRNRSNGPIITMSFMAENRDIKKIFKAAKRTEPYSINIEWKDA